MPHQLATSVLIAALLALAAACASSEGPCDSADDCDGDQLCVSGQCVASCQTDRDCADRRICVERACIVPARCRAQEDCRVGELCEAGYCYPQTPECERSRDCPPFHYCDRGACLLDQCDGPEDCRPGQRCEDNRCTLADAEDAGGSDLDAGTDGPLDTSSADGEVDGDDDTPGSEDSPVEDGLEVDTCGGDGCIDDAVADAEDPCEGRDDGRLGDPCRGAGDCCNGLCLGAEGEGICTEACSVYADCDRPGLIGEYFCYDTGESGQFCARSDFGAPCGSPDPCLGQVCLRGQFSSGCSWQCETTAACPPDSACGLVAFGDAGDDVFYMEVCTPVGDSCEVDASGLNDCLSGTCLTDDNGENGFCSVFCDTTDPNPCPAGFDCQVVDSEFPAVCVR